MRHYPGLRQASKPLTAEYLRSRDCVVIVTDHSAYDWEFVGEYARLVVDTRNAMKVIATRQTIIRA
jgi:UDP-N-acetyl-D-glucosamine dehydrogenase